MKEAQIAAMADELQKMGGLGSGIMNFLRSGAGAFKSLGSKAGRAGLWGATKELPGQLSRAWQQGGWRHVGKVLQHAEPVQMAAMGAGGLYAAKKGLNLVRGRRQQQQPY